MSFTKQLKNLAILLPLLTMTLHANAGLLLNGSFEEHSMQSKRYQMLNDSSVSGWSSAKNKIELWHKNFLNVQAVDGNTIVELNNFSSDTLFQEFDTVIGQLYEITFNYRARANNQEQFEVYVQSISGSDVGMISRQMVDDHIVGSWSEKTIRFVGQSTRTRLSFSSLSGTSGSVGNLLDNVDVRAIPEPGSIALLGIGLLGLVRLRKGSFKKDKK